MIGLENGRLGGVKLSCIKVKLCGMTRECDIAYANEAQPDYAGFVFAGTKRRISRDMADRKSVV